jgi:hypothetical protein
MESEMLPIYQVFRTVHLPTDPIRVEHQSEDSKDPWDRTTTIAGRPRRQADRVKAMSPIGPSRQIGL